MPRRGRPRTVRQDPRPQARYVTHCPRGHEYTPDNTYVHPTKGYRKCRACQHEWSRRAFRQKLYGISLEQYEWLLASQAGRCAICGSETNSGVALSVDHDHRSGRVRGILCDPCNIGIGGLREDPVLLRAAITYLERPPLHLPTLVLASAQERCYCCGRETDNRDRRIIDGQTRTACGECPARQD